jgi:molybdate transport system substrate-binding protein
MVVRQSLSRIGDQGVTRRLALGAAAILVADLPASAAGRVLVAAASDLQSVFPSLAAAFKEAHGIDVVASFGSTGNFSRQIRQGAPFEVFLAADERFIQDLARDGVVADAGRAYARGRLGLVASRRGPFAAALSLESLADAVVAGRPFRLAIANPEHAPYGQRAVEVLNKSPQSAQLLSRVVYGETVTQAHQMVATGAVAVGISAMSLEAVASTTVVMVELPERLHTPLVQRLCVTRHGGDAARAFAAFMVSPAASGLLKAHGFAEP